MADDALRLFLDGALDGPLTAFLVGFEGLFSIRREPPGIHLRRGLLWFFALAAARALLGAVPGPVHALLPAALVCAFALLRIGERALALEPLEAACAAGTLPAFLFLHPQARDLPLREFLPWLLGVLAAFTLFRALSERFGEALDRREPFGRFGGVMLLLLSLTGILIVSTAFRGLIR